MTLDDVELQRSEDAGLETAERLLRSIHKMRAYPSKDEQGVLRHGFGRQIERRPMSEAVAAVALRDDLRNSASVLRARIFELKGMHPAFPDDRIALIYALADILGAPETRDWNPIWNAMRLQDWAKAAEEMLSCHMLRVMSETPSQRTQVSQLIVMMISGHIPQARR